MRIDYNRMDLEFPAVGINGKTHEGTIKFLLSEKE